MAERKNIMDGHFAGISDVDVRYRDTNSIYKPDTTVEHFFQILGKYHAKYVLDTQNVKNIYDFAGYSFPGVTKLFDAGEARVYGIR